MVKKVLCITFMLIMLMNVSVLAETFTLHSGTYFGMNRDEVIVYEQEKGYFSDLVAGETTSKKLSTKGTFAGRDNGEMIYAFDKEGKLVQFHYSFKNGEPNDFDSLNNSLVSKYGPPDYSSDQSSAFAVDMKWYPEQTEDTPIIWNGYAPMTGKSIDNVRMKAFLFDLLGTKLYNYQDYNCDKYAQWLIRDKDGSAVLIDHCYLSVEAFQSESPVSKKTNYTSDYYDLVIYTYISSEEMEALDSASAQVMDDL